MQSVVCCWSAAIVSGTMDQIFCWSGTMEQIYEKIDLAKLEEEKARVMGKDAEI